MTFRITPDEQVQLKESVTAYLAEHKESKASLGRRICNDSKFVAHLLSGHQPVGRRRFTMAAEVLQAPPPILRLYDPDPDLVADLFSEDFSEDQIAKQLGTSVRAVRRVWSQIKREMGA